MFNATYFIYNGTLSALYGLKIASFDGSNSPQETAIFSPNITTAKAKNMRRFYSSSIDFDSPPEMNFSVVSETVINNIAKREILAWLTSGNDFKKLEIMENDGESYYYMCKFSQISEITVGGFCVGFNLVATLDSYYQYGKSTVATLEDGEHNEAVLNIINKSDINDDYVYPAVSFKLSAGNTIKIVNITDDDTRVFEFVGVPENTTITVDNDLKIIDGQGVLLSNFNKNWLRLKKGTNVLKITGNGSVTITCPQLMLVGF